MTTFYRPLNNDFLDQCQPEAFWNSEESAKRDFPGQVKAYPPEELQSYLRNNNLKLDDIEVYE